MIFDWTISLGNLVAMVGFIIGGIAVVNSMRTDIRVLAAGLVTLGKEMAAVEKDLEKITNVVVQMARQEERLSAMDRRMNDLANRTFSLENGGRKMEHPPHPQSGA